MKRRRKVYHAEELLNTRWSPETKEQLWALAQVQRRSMNEVIVEAVRRVIAEQPEPVQEAMQKALADQRIRPRRSLRGKPQGHTVRAVPSSPTDDEPLPL